MKRPDRNPRRTAAQGAEPDAQIRARARAARALLRRLCEARHFCRDGVLMASVLVTLAVSYAMLRRIPVMPLVTAVIVLIFGSLTLVFHDETLIKIKPTALYVLFAAALFAGLALKKPLLKSCSTARCTSPKKAGASSPGAGPSSSWRSPCSTRLSGAPRRPPTGSSSKRSAFCP